jgi:predicted phage-related endonuclease
MTLLFNTESARPGDSTRRSFIGGSDARIIMGSDEAALVRLWGEKRGEVEPEDLSGNLIVQLGTATEALNRHWYERNTAQTVECVQHRFLHPVLRWMGATLDGIIAGRGTVFEGQIHGGGRRKAPPLRLPSPRRSSS